MAQRFDEFVNLQFADPSTGAASGLMNLSRQFEGFRQQAFEARKRRVIQEGVDEARTTELEKVKGITQAPEKREEGFFGSVKAKAYNETLARAYANSLSNDIGNKIESLKNDALLTPDGIPDIAKFDKAVDSFRNAVIENVDPMLKQAAQAEIDDLITSTSETLRVEARKKNLDIASDDLIRTANDSGFRAVNLARTSGDTEQAKIALETSIASLQDAADRNPTRRSAYEADIRDLKREYQENVGRNSFQNTFDSIAEKDGEQAALQKIIEQVEEKRGKPKGDHTADQWDTYLDSVLADYSAQATKAASISAREKNALRYEWKNLNAQADLGTLGADGLNRLAKVGYTLEKAPQEIRDAYAVAQFSGQPIAARERQLEILRSQEDAVMTERLAKANADINARYENNPVVEATAQGVIEPVELASFTPEAVNDYLAQSEQNVLDMQAHFGTPSKILPNGEGNRLARWFRGEIPKEDGTLPTIQERAQVIASHSGNKMLWDQMAGEGGGLMAALATTSSPAMVELGLLGKEKLDQKAVTPPGGADGYKEIALDHFSATTEPDVMTSQREAALAIMYGQTNVFDDEIYTDALKQVSGVSMGNIMTPPNVSKSKMDDFFDNVDESFLDGIKFLGLDKSDVIGEIRRGNLVQIGVGEYKVVVGNGEVQTLDGETFKFDLDNTSIDSAIYEGRFNHETRMRALYKERIRNRSGR